MAELLYSTESPSFYFIILGSRCPPDVEVDLVTNADLFEILSAKHAEMTYFAILGIYTTSAIKATLTDIIALPNSCPR